MVLQKRLEYGFNGYQVPPTPRAARSARKKVSSWKKPEDNNRMCAFDLLATVAGKLLLEGHNNSVDKLSQEETLVVEDSNVKTEENRLNVNICDQGSCKSFFVSEIISKAPFTDTFSCKIEDRNDKETKLEDTKDKNGKPPVVDNLDSNVNLVIRDDYENSSGCTPPPTLNNTTFRLPPRIGDRRIRRLLVSKQWKVEPKLNDDAHFNTDLKPVYRDKKNFYKHQRSLRDYPFKKRRLYELDNLSNFDDKSNSKGSIEDHSGLGAKTQDPTFQARDSHVKLKIKSFRVPEFFIEIPETATVGSLKRTVMEAVTAIFSGELGVGVMLQGKKIGDDNKTLLQMGICHDNELDALGFTLEPKKLRVSPSLCPEDKDRCVVLPPGTPKLLTRYSPPQSVANFTNLTESDHDSTPSHSDSRAVVPVRAVDSGALAVVPMRKTKQADISQRRIRRPFSVSEVEALVQAVEKLGTGRWRDVKLRAFDNAKHRTYVDLKDKWKTLVHTAKISPQQRRGEPVPQELLDRVLAAHGYWLHHQAKHQFKHQSQPETCRLI